MSDRNLQSRKVSYRRMKDGTKEDYTFMAENAEAFKLHTADRLLGYPRPRKPSTSRPVAPTQ